MEILFNSGFLVDLVLLLVLVEAGALVAYFLFKRKGIPLADLLPNLFAGAFLLLALRTVIVGGGWMVACACLAAAGLSHVIDLKRRWRR
jgi:hypothetical protein